MADRFEELILTVVVPDHGTKPGKYPRIFLHSTSNFLYFFCKYLGLLIGCHIPERK